MNTNNQEEQGAACDIETGVCSPSEQVGEPMEEMETGPGPKLKLTYYYDALCGWCYGFSPVVEQMQAEYGDRIDLQVVSGGLFLGERVGKINDIAPYIRSGAYKSVELRTGVKFGEPFLNDVMGEGGMTMNSWWAAVALCIVREWNPEKSLEFAGTLLRAFYQDGLDPVNLHNYGACAERIGFSAGLMLKSLEEDKYLEQAKADFASFQASGLRGMPALVVEAKGERMLLSNGYVDYEDELKPRLERLLN